MPYFGIPIRNGLPIGLGSVAGFGIAPFEPYSLFENGEQGAWYDPSDFSTLFTDSAGTTPVTGVEQFVGLMLDKSKGLVLGSELVVNPDFTTDTWWVKGAGVTISGGAANFSAATGYGLYRTGVSGLVAGAYEVTFTVTNYVSGGIRPYVGATATFGTTVSANGTYTQKLYTSSSGELGFNASSAFTGSIDNVSIKQIAGNHATQTASAKRPKLAARYNLLTYTEQFDNGAWTKSGINAFGSGSVANTTATTDPLGGNTADFIQENNSAGTHEVVYSNFPVSASTRYTCSVRIKAAGRSWCQFVLGPSTYFGSGGIGAYFDITNGTVGTVTSNATALPVASITSLGNGWYQCSLSATSNAASGTADFNVRIAQNGSTVSYTGDGTSGIYIWGADLRPASQATGLIGPTYQRVVDAATYDTVGFLPYLQFDGLDDSMSTNSIDFSAVPTDKMTVWAGVRKQAAGLGMIAELSASVSTNNGSFYIAADNGTNDYGVSLKGTAQVTYQPATYAAPITNVISAAFDIGAAAIADENKPRVNGVLEQDNPTGADAGTGNFGNYPLYIGQRGGSTLPFNGWLTSLIVRGAQSTQSQIEATESWVAGKTGVSL